MAPLSATPAWQPSSIRPGPAGVGGAEPVAACRERIAAVDEVVHAYVRASPEDPVASTARSGAAFAVKDVIDTADLPTEHGSPIHAGRGPGQDAAVVALLRRAGATMLGKSATTELATFPPGPCINPYDPARTPGGSSSGSAAARAAGMACFALGTQTGGSVVRPSASCGVVGCGRARRAADAACSRSAARSAPSASTRARHPRRPRARGGRRAPRARGCAAGCSTRSATRPRC